MLASHVWLMAAELSLVVGKISITRESPRVFAPQARLCAAPAVPAALGAQSHAQEALGCSGVPDERVSGGRAHGDGQCYVNPNMVTLGSPPFCLEKAHTPTRGELQSFAQA